MADKQAVEALKVTASVQLARLGGDAEVDVRTMNDYLKAQANVDEAKRELDHTVIYAPFDGIVTQVETVQPGMYLSAATAAFGLVSTDNVWIEANPKETELTYVKRGDPVDVTVDTYPGRVWKAEVESIAPNSGSEFSVLPAQNTSGNWVKVVQRIPVRIKIEHQDGDPALRAGMSVVADIDTGHHRSWRDLF
jgi:membrane fusion protein (multidrug efflux system)